MKRKTVNELAADYCNKKQFDVIVKANFARDYYPDAADWLNVGMLAGFLAGYKACARRKLK